MKTILISITMIGFTFLFICLDSYSITCNTMCGSCGVFDGDEFDECLARRRTCLDECMAKKNAEFQERLNQVRNSKPAQSFGQYQDYPATSAYQDEGQYCCDSWGNPRCIVYPSPLGSTCFCPGQGYGIVCQ